MKMTTLNLNIKSKPPKNKFPDNRPQKVSKMIPQKKVHKSNKIYQSNKSSIYIMSMWNKYNSNNSYKIKKIITWNYYKQIKVTLKINMNLPRLSKIKGKNKN